MVLKTEYEREYWYDVDAYLVENYPTMNMDTRRAVCKLALESIDSETIEDTIDFCVGQHAQAKLNIEKKEQEEEENE